jgi:hypothetical protein
LHTFTQTKKRASILRELETSLASLERASNLIRVRYPKRAHRILNHAQSVASTIELLAYDWHDEDAKPAAA